MVYLSKPSTNWKKVPDGVTGYNYSSSGSAYSSRPCYYPPSQRVSTAMTIPLSLHLQLSTLGC